VTDDHRTTRGADDGTGEPSAVARLLRDAISGDATAGDHLYRAVAGWVTAVGRGLGLGREDVADVNQIVCLRLVSHLERLRAPEALRGWVVTVARHESYRVLRDRHRHAIDLDPSGDIALQLADPALPPVDERLLRTERHRELYRALGKLSAGCQRLLRLLATDPPLSYAEAAAVLDRPIGAIGPTRQRCLGRLREILGDEHARNAAAEQSTMDRGRPASRVGDLPIVGKDNRTGSGLPGSGGSGIPTPPAGSGVGSAGGVNGPGGAHVDDTGTGRLARRVGRKGGRS
jgi:RNA polymerase sigma factor (sigma-70 family)